MRCPCCHGALAHPPAFVRVLDGDRYCAQCQWVVDVEILERQTRHSNIGGASKCPTHGDAQVGDLTVMEVHEFDERFRAAIASFPQELRPELGRILDLPDGERAAELGTLFQDGRLWPLAGLLIDLEEEPALRKLTAAELREMAHHHRHT